MENIESSVPVEERTSDAPTPDSSIEQESDAHRVDDASDAHEAKSGRGLRAAWSSWAGARALYMLAGVVVVGFVFWWLQFSTGSICCGDFDGYYHVRWSQILWEGIRSGKFPPPFTALPLTTLNPTDYVDHHFLFHILQIPYTWFADTVLAAKIGTMIFGTLAVISCYWLILRYRIRYPLVWLVALMACSTPFLFRMNMAKAMSVSIVLMVVGIYLLFERRYGWLLPLTFLFALSYDMFALLCAASFIWACVMFWSERRIEVRPVVLTLVGALAGFVINPYFPHNIELFIQHVLMKATKGGFTASVGGEWYPYNTWEFLLNSGVACVAMVTGYIAFQSGDRKLAARPLFFLVFATILLLANAKWKRFAEYWPPFAVLFAAFSLQPIFEGARAFVRQLPTDVLDELKPFLDHQATPATTRQQQRARLLEYAVAAVVAVLLGLQTIANVQSASNEIADSAPPDHYQRGMEWIRANVPAGETIFNTDWDDFPRLFYFSPRHSYVSGLDPTYLLDQNQELFKLHEEITLGKEKDPARIIRERFKARYVFTDKQEVHDEFYNTAMDSGWFEEVYDDDHCTVLRILDQWRQPPPDPGDNPAATTTPSNTDIPNEETDDPDAAATSPEPNATPEP
ncbi:MAG TPA: hypothetical protein VF666_01590 [Pyrinomonadaceae bacterium]|jgi:hypothetical protein